MAAPPSSIKSSTRQHQHRRRAEVLAENDLPLLAGFLPAMRRGFKRFFSGVFGHYLVKGREPRSRTHHRTPFTAYGLAPRLQLTTNDSRLFNMLHRIHRWFLKRPRRRADR